MDVADGSPQRHKARPKQEKNREERRGAEKCDIKQQLARTLELENAIASSHSSFILLIS